MTPDHNKSTKQTESSVLETDVDIQEFNLEKARLEVHRFGITGYGKGKERILEQERAIMLGAKPPKKSYVNYKVLQEQIKEKRQQRKKKRDWPKKQIFSRKRRGKDRRTGNPKRRSPLPVFCQMDGLDRLENSKMEH